MTGLCRKHYQYNYVNGFPEIPGATDNPLSIDEKWALWLAGVIDCEGWIGLYKSRRKDGFAYWPGIAVGNTNKLLTDKVFSLVGIGSVSLTERKAPNKHIHTWRINKTSDVRSFLLRIEPHLILKREQALLVLSLPPINTKDPDIRASIHARMRVLNMKGRS